MILNAIDGRALPIYGDGGNVRDWLYVQDHCEAIWTVIQKGAVGRTYNIGGNTEKPNIDVVETICDILDETAADNEIGSRRDLITFVTDARNSPLARRARTASPSLTRAASVSALPSASSTIA